MSKQLSVEETIDPSLRTGYACAAVAMTLLDVRLQTLYAYVSRGWIRSLPQPGRKDRLYLREDIDRMLARSRAKSGQGAIAAAAMRYRGDPIIPTSITEITPEGPRYRGRLVLDLVRCRAPFEAVAEWLWTGLWHEEAQPQWTTVKLTSELRGLIRSLPPLQGSGQIIELLALVTLHLGLSRATSDDCIRSGQTLDDARQIIQTLVGFCGFASSKREYVQMQIGQSVLDGLLRSLGIPLKPENSEAVGAILTVLADHELSPGTLAARVAASSGCTLHNCIAAALCSSSGLEIGKLYSRIDEFLEGAETKTGLVEKAQRLREQAMVMPGFVHPMYPQGGPRASMLLEIARRRPDPTQRLAAIFGFLDDMRSRFNLLPRQEFAVVVLTRDMGLSAVAPGALFALARTVGWVAHVQEQRLYGGLLRPRAKFVGTSQGAASALR
jgi:citrate synthase